MMTKKHFVAIAEILGQYSVEPELAEGFANYFETQNPSFDRTRFIDLYEDIYREVGLD